MAPKEHNVKGEQKRQTTRQPPKRAQTAAGALIAHRDGLDATPKHPAVPPYGNFPVAGSIGNGILNPSFFSSLSPM